MNHALIVPSKSLILVVDDDNFIRNMLIERLKLRGYRTESAVNGREALSLLEKNTYDLILLDIMMPELNGFQVLEKLRESPDPPPIIVMSALDDVDSVVRCIELGAEDYLYKPIKSQLMWARMKATLEKKLLRDQEQNRLDELNLLQQIDLELNTTMDLEEVARITLFWAMHKTGAIAGLMGAVHDTKLVLWAEKDIGVDGVTEFSLQDLQIGLPLPDLMYESVPESACFHGDARYRILLSIHRDRIIRDLLILELKEECSDEMLDFLFRLGNHAAIALHNAQLYGDVQAANLAKSNFVAMVSHELKNPLMAIQSYTDILRRGVVGNLGSKQDHFLQVIRASADRIQNLALELDDITRIETGQFNLEFTAVSFSAVLEGVLNLLAQKRQEKHQTLHLQVAPDLPLVQADEHRLGQILTNLISNAIKYTPQNGEITIQAYAQNNSEKPMLYVSVRDTGIGISEADQSHIFSQFFRASDSAVRAEVGTGLGLNIAKKLVESHGGQIGFTSEYGVGTTFYFTLPLSTTETAVSNSP